MIVVKKHFFAWLWHLKYSFRLFSYNFQISSIYSNKVWHATAWIRHNFLFCSQTVRILWRKSIWACNMDVITSLWLLRMHLQLIISFELWFTAIMQFNSVSRVFARLRCLFTVVNHVWVCFMMPERPIFEISLNFLMLG